MIAAVRAVAAGALLALAGGAGAAPAGEPRIALVIGNAAYRDAPLLNPVNDAKAVSAALRASGFEVIERHNQSATDMRRAIREFGERLRGKGAGVFYFAGHGVQVNGRNFLIPTQSDIKYEDEIEDQSVDVSLVLGKMESAKARINIVILDACRNNPFVRGARSAQAGLAAMEAPIGSLIAYATSPGQVASDGEGANGLYTRYLVREIGQPGLKVEDVFKRVRAAVRQASAGRQVPWENTSLEGDFYFRAPERAEGGVNLEELRRQQDREVQRAVAEALTQSREEADRERRKLEAQFTERLETERAAMRKEALERIAAAEKAGQAATVRPPAPSAPMPAPAEAPDPVMVALGATIFDSKPATTSPDVREGRAPPPRVAGDKWVYFRQVRDGEGVTRRNYVTLTMGTAGTGGYDVDALGVAEPYRYDAAGNLRSAPNPTGGVVSVEPADPLYRFPLVPGESWVATFREILPGHARELEGRVNVVGWEDVQVPAGTFRAMKISQSANVSWQAFAGQPTQRSRRVANVWYVPELRHFARYEVLEVTQAGVIVKDHAWELDAFKLH